jgi:hypothetical protein
VDKNQPISDSEEYKIVESENSHASLQNNHNPYTQSNSGEIPDKMD